jgi:hypothetical protein
LIWAKKRLTHLPIGSIETSLYDHLGAVRKVRKVFSKEQRYETKYDCLMMDAAAGCYVQRSGFGV